MAQATPPPGGNGRATWWALGFGVVFLVIGALAVVGPWVVRHRDLAIDAAGQQATGRIEDVSRSLADGGDGEYTISYSFTAVDGSERHATRSVSESFWRSAAAGESVEIRYDPDRPADSHPLGFGQTSVGVALFVTTVGVLIGSFGAVLVAAAARSSGGRPPD